MTREEANKLITEYNTEIRAAILARKGSKKQSNAMLGLAVVREKLVAALTRDGADDLAT